MTYPTIQAYVLAGKSRCSLEQMQTAVERICDYLMVGKTLFEAGRLSHAPSSTITRWMADCDEIAKLIFRARTIGAHAMADLAVQEAMQATEDTAKIAKVRVNALQWAASRHNRAYYGDAIQHELRGTINLKAAIDAGYKRAQEMRSITDENGSKRIQANDNDTKLLPATIVEKTVGLEANRRNAFKRDDADSLADRIPW